MPVEATSGRDAGRGRRRVARAATGTSGPSRISKPLVSVAALATRPRYARSRPLASRLLRFVFYVVSAVKLLSYLRNWSTSITDTRAWLPPSRPPTPSCGPRRRRSPHPLARADDWPARRAPEVAAGSGQAVSQVTQASSSIRARTAVARPPETVPSRSGHERCGTFFVAVASTTLRNSYPQHAGDGRGAGDEPTRLSGAPRPADSPW